jgi:hypothetical protein
MQSLFIAPLQWVSHVDRAVCGDVAVKLLEELADANLGDSITELETEVGMCSQPPRSFLTSLQSAIG